MFQGHFTPVYNIYIRLVDLYMSLCNFFYFVYDASCFKLKESLLICLGEYLEQYLLWMTVEIVGKDWGFVNGWCSSTLHSSRPDGLSPHCSPTVLQDLGGNELL